MYIGFIQDRKILGFRCLTDVDCGIRLVRSTDLTLSKLLATSKFKPQVVYVFVRELPFQINRKSKRVGGVIVLVIGFWFTDLKPSEAIV